MEFDFKITAWERVTVPQEDEQRVVDGIKNGTITSANDIFALDIDADCCKLDEVEEQMSPEENGGSSTIEVFEGTTLVFKNGE